MDVDYKALSDAGTWFIGKLGTDQDKQRLLDGLSSAAAAGTALVRSEYDDLLDDFTTEHITPYKKDIDVTHFGIAWYPYHVLEDNGRTVTLPAFEERAAGS